MNKKLLLLPILGLLLLAGTAQASHAWSKYHWDLSTDASTAAPLKLGNNLTTASWNTSLSVASTDWNNSVLKNQVVAGTSNANCDPTLGQVEVCNSAYGGTGWLGIAQIWVYRGKDGHIAQGLVKVNDTYFNTATYNTQSWRDYVMCQEVGHTFGLGHQDEAFGNANLGTCMDYTNDPDGTSTEQLDNRHPNQHDYNMMTDIYAHLNGVPEDSGGDTGGKPNKCSPWPSCKQNSRGTAATIDHNDPSAWGRAVSQDAQGNDSLFERDLGNGQTLITHVLWTQ